MLDSLIFSLNAILPLIILVVLGFLLNKYRILPEPFLLGADKAVFNLALPVYLFVETYTAQGLDELFNPKLIAFCLSAVVVLLLSLCVIVPLIIKDKKTRGAMIQGIYRTNFAILGIPLAGALFGDEGTKIAVVLLSTTIPIYNVAAVIILSVNTDDGKGKVSVGKVLLNIVKNPLIIAIVLALTLKFTGLILPAPISKSLSHIAGMSTPLALIALGAGFKFSELGGGRLKKAAIAVAFKNVIVPVIMCSAAILLGFRNAELGLVFVLFGAPTAVSSYIMAKNMKSDYQLAGQIVLLTTCVSAFTIFLGTFVMKSAGLI